MKIITKHPPYYFFLVFFFISSNFAQGSNNKLDSLYQVYLNEEDEKIQLDILNNISVHMLMKDRGLAVNLASKAVQLSLKSNDLVSIAKANYNYGYLMRYDEKGDSSLFYLYRSKKMFEELNDTSQLGYIYTQLSANYNNLGDKATSIKMMDSASQFWEQTKDYALVSRCFSILGGMYGEVGSYESSLKIGLRSLALSEKLNDSISICRSYSSLAGIYRDLGDISSSKSYYYKALDISSRHGDQIMRYLIFSNLGITFHSNQQNDSALWSRKQALILLDTNARPNYYSNLSIGLANTYLALGDYTNMKIHLDIANKLANTKGYKKHFPIIQRLYGDYYNHGKKEYYKARKYYERGIEFAKDQNRFEIQGELFTNLGKLAKERGDEKEALMYSELLLEHTDSTHKLGKEIALRNSQIELDLEKKDLKIDILSKESEINKRKSSRQKLLIFGSSFLALLIGILAFLRIKQSRLKQKLKLEIFRNKVATDLHDDVGSILTAVAMQSEILGVKSTEENKPKLDKIGELSREAMSSMRDTVWAIDSSKDKMESLIDRMKDYLVSVFQDSETITYKFYPAEGINLKDITPEQRQNIYLIFKEAIANIIKHSDGNKVTIDFSKENNELLLQIIDNGSKKETKSSSGLGINSMTKRAEKIGGKLTIEQNPNSFAVKLTVPN